jgi:hypothetical protein
MPKRLKRAIFQALPGRSPNRPKVDALKTMAGMMRDGALTSGGGNDGDGNSSGGNGGDGSDGVA